MAPRTRAVLRIQPYTDAEEDLRDNLPQSPDSNVPHRENPEKTAGPIGSRQNAVKIPTLPGHFFRS